MEKAKDTSTGKKVSASDPTLRPNKNRYICPHCGEKVFLAAIHSKKCKPYFKHAAGNNGKACEDYFRTHSDSDEDEQFFPDPNFYYRSDEKKLYLSIKLDAETIEEYAQGEAKYEVENSTRKKLASLSINYQFFSPDEPSRFYIPEVSSVYFCGVSSNEKSPYVVFRKGETAVFRVYGDDVKNFSAKLIEGDTLYTNTVYFILSSDSILINEICSYRKITKVLQNSETIKIGNRELRGVLCKFLEADYHVGNALRKYDYRLERSGTFDVLWPPINETASGYVSPPQDIFISANFSLPEVIGEDQDVRYISNGLYKLELTDALYLYYKNVDVFIACEEPDQPDFEGITVDKSKAEEFVVSDDSDYYLYSSEGVRKLFKGEKIFLRPGDIVKEYWQTYVISICEAPKKIVHRKKLLENVLRNYKVTIPYDNSEFDNIKMTDVIKEYLGGCKKTGLINLAIARMIREGKL